MCALTLLESLPSERNLEYIVVEELLATAAAKDEDSFMICLLTIITSFHITDILYE